MRTTTKALIAGAALATVGATAAQAQFPFDIFGGGQQPYGYGYGAPDTATLYEFPNYQGRSVTVHRDQTNLDSVGFNDRARSIRATGSWRLCEDANYRSRCETIHGSVADLRRSGIQGLSSLQMIGGGYGYPGGGYGSPGYGQGPVQGRDVVFYPGTVSHSYGSPYGYGGGYGYPGSRRTADEFCRSMGHRNAVWSDRSGGELSDVLCRR